MTEEPNVPDLNKDGLPDSQEKSIWNSRRKMAWVSLWAIILPTIFIIVFKTDAPVVEKLADLMSWYYLGLASVVGAFFGFTAWASIRGRGAPKD